jgi:SAM-dependent methyltransferase|tara:strand:+ start:723 stop:1388 length:666 start_codon:yes stop_codon:yes gene_type:complete
MRLTAMKNSLNRIFQLIYAKKFFLDGKTIEFGASKNSSKSFVNFLNISNQEDIVFADKQQNKKGDFINENLEGKLSFENDTFENIIIFNVLEHVYEIDNAIGEIHRCLKKDGKLIGSTPFLHRIHYAPEDYNRYTPQFLKKLLIKKNFDNISIEVFGYGPFIAAYAMIFDYTKFIPLFNNFIFTICFLLDKFLGLFIKTDLKEIYPVSICFSATKKINQKK